MSDRHVSESGGPPLARRYPMYPQARRASTLLGIERNAFHPSTEGEDDLARRLDRYLSRAQIPMLHGMRFIAVSLVILYHYGLPAPGAHGVLIFFVLSGFLITWLLLREFEKYGKVSLSGFYRRRILRIFPAFYFYWFALVGMLLVAHKKILWPQALSSFFYLSNYYSAIHGDPNTGFSHTWSLGIEEQFYLIWPILFVAFQGKLGKLTFFLSGLIGAVWLHRVVLYFAFHVDQEYFYSAFDTRMDSLMVGCLLAVLLKRRVLMNVWRTLCRNIAVPVGILSLLVLSIVEGPAVFPRYRDVIGFAVDPILVAILMVQLIAFSSTPYLRWLDGKVIVFLGNISYSLYLWQQLTLDLSGRKGNLPPVLHFIGAIAFTLLAACFSYYAIERPFLKLKDRRAKVQPAESVAEQLLPIQAPAIQVAIQMEVPPAEP
jgi:peptidoglycan/LPS O-acetylase OafA/YrhL